MPKIRVLPDSVARKIAAGEVIERPMSVVKELLENSLDAGARAIVVELEQGGRARIAMTDDGEGMSRDDLLLAFQPHATSKIHDAEDLSHISTFGFRGEALPSIAAVADVEVWSRQRGEMAGTHVRFEQGKPVLVEEAGVAAGCRIEASGIFSRMPARRKFLKAAAAEAGQVAQLVGRFALAHPDIAFELRQERRDSLSWPPGSRCDRIRRVLGSEIEAEMQPVEYRGEVSLSGFATHPHFSLANSRSILFFVNGRLVRDKMLLHAVFAAYSTLLPHGRHPAAVLFLDVAPEEVDVNVHPAKAEVRFRNSQRVHEAIGRALREALHIPRAAAPALDRTPVAAESSPLYAPPAPESPPAGSERRVRLVPPGARNDSLPFPAGDGFASLRIVGQLFSGYIVCEGDGEIVLIDQHAAHERVAFEKLQAARKSGRIETQAMLVPQPIEVGVGEADMVDAAADDLAACGLEVEPFGDRAVLVRAVPAILPPTAIVPLVRAIVADLGELQRSRAVDVRTERLLATVACHSAVRVGQKLSESEIRGLLSGMDSIDLNSNCPHGRPVARRMPRSELERRFGR